MLFYDGSVVNGQSVMDDLELKANFQTVLVSGPDFLLCILLSEHLELNMSKYSPDLENGGHLATGQDISRMAENLATAPSNVQASVRQDGLSEALQARRLRHSHFPEKLFGEPAWDMLLELLNSGEEGRVMSVTELCEVARVPGQVAWRWISVMEGEGLVLRQPDPNDPSSEVIQLEPNTRATFRRYFDDLSKAR